MPMSLRLDNHSERNSDTQQQSPSMNSAFPLRLMRYLIFLFPGCDITEFQPPVLDAGWKRPVKQVTATPLPVSCWRWSPCCWWRQSAGSRSCCSRRRRRRRLCCAPPLRRRLLRTQPSGLPLAGTRCSAGSWSTASPATAGATASSLTPPTTAACSTSVFRR